MHPAEYTIEEHMHRFAVWTAARAASRSRLKNSEVEYLINASKLREEVQKLRDRPDLTEGAYREWLMSKGEEIVTIAKKRNWSDFKTKTFCFGLAAKIISIYIKTVEVLPTKGLSKLSQVAHPPIDGILLRALISSKNEKMKTNWATFDANAYLETINWILRGHQSIAGWQIEYAWKVSDEEEKNLNLES